MPTFVHFHPLLLLHIFAEGFVGGFFAFTSEKGAREEGRCSFPSSMAIVLFVFQSPH